MAREPGFRWKPTLAAFVVAFSSLLLVNFVILPSLDAGPSSGSPVSVHGVSIIVNYKNGTVEQRDNLSITGTPPTVFALLAREFLVEHRVYSNGYLVISINHARGGYVFSIDGTSPNTAVNKVALANNSLVNWTQVS